MLNKLLDSKTALTGAPKIAKTMALALHHRNITPEMIVFIRKTIEQSKEGQPVAQEIMKEFTKYIYNSGKFCPDAINKISQQIDLIIKDEY